MKIALQEAEQGWEVRNTGLNPQRVGSTEGLYCLIRHTLAVSMLCMQCIVMGAVGQGMGSTI
jgi:hypothetical protein